MKYKSQHGNMLGELELSSHTRLILIRNILANYDERKGSLDEYILADELRSNRPHQFPINDFYWFLINNKSYSNYMWDISQMKDWKGLRMLLESKDDQEFARRYVDENIYTVLEKAIELYNDPSESRFFEKNIDIISAARKYTEGYYAEFVSDAAESIFYALESGINIDDTEMLLRLMKEYEAKKESEIIYPQISRERMLELVKEVLNDIDSTGELSQCFDEKMQEGRIVIFNKDEKDRARMQFETVLESKEFAEKAVQKKQCFLPQFDVVCLPVKDSVVDVPAIIHEFIHQYHDVTEKYHGYSVEVPTVYFEKYAIDYLISHGFEQDETILMDSFATRKINDAGNNASVTNKYIGITKLKHDEGSITKENFMQDIQNAWDVLLKNGADVDDIKKKYAEALIKAFSNRNREENEMIRNLCSYSLGTYFAGEYSNDEQMKQRMLQLVKNPEYTLQNLIDELNAPEQNKEDKKIMIDNESMDR